VFVTKRRNRNAASKFLRKAMKQYGTPKVIVTDKLQSYQAAMKEIDNEVRQETGRRLNNRAKNSHQPFRRRERAIARFHHATKIHLCPLFNLQPFQSPTTFGTLRNI
jgi:putative transposase